MLPWAQPGQLLQSRSHAVGTNWSSEAAHQLCGGESGKWDPMGLAGSSVLISKGGSFVPAPEEVKQLIKSILTEARKQAWGGGCGYGCEARVL